ncbi:putative non-ribosomal peptide synthase-like protein [Saccharata proteae CBS 121410]|uniref:Non-ribosomal peptide synthase-like protein n=1 Tax=Saccharata proteae CBS 121410 TaxID=1314787 RepID=A0A9P4HV84_9PEZI|nr:putative non-ribosomal peptide synthase-like protein [Saccharata proteae CBS 121410]
MLSSITNLIYQWIHPSSLFGSKADVEAIHKNGGPKTLLALLKRAAKLYPKNGITFKDQGWDGKPEFLTYKDLLREVMTNAAKLRQADVVSPRKPVVLYFNTHRDNVIWYWSVVTAGGIPALLSPLSNNEVTLAGELDNINKLFNGPTVLTTKQLSRLFRPIEGIKSITVHSVAMVKLEEGLGMEMGISGNVDEVVDEGIGYEDSLATLLFTSGSTGYAKAVEYTHKQLVDSSRLKSTFHKMDSSKTFLSWISFDHSAALCENHLHALHAGANQVMVPAIDLVQKPARFWNAISEHRVAYTFAPNFFIAAATRGYKAMSEKEKILLNYDFSELRVIMCGGEANRTSTMEAAEMILTKYGAPKCSIKAAYGLSETCSALWYNTESPTYDLKHGYVFASVGKHLPEHTLRLVDENRKPVKKGTQGAIQVRGAMIFKQYYNNEAANKACMTPDGWFDTGDLGLLDEAGNLRIVGRSKEVLIINGQNYSSFELEHAIESAKIPMVTPSYIASFSIWAEDAKADSEDIVILFNPTGDLVKDSPELRNAIGQINEATIRFCRKRPAMVVPLPRAKLPKSTIGKLSRAKLKKSFMAGDFDSFKLPEMVERSNEQRGPPLTTPLQKILETVLVNEAAVKASDLHMDLPIAELGIDSLGYLRVKSALEKALDAQDPISMSSFLACRTVRDVDNMLLLLGTTTPEYDPIVPLVTTGSKTPLILCPPGGGEFLTWLGLLPYIPDRPVFALRVRGFHKNEKLFETLDEMLEVYIAGIKAHQPEGPYALLGLCFGGMLSFELAKRLEARGDKVLFIGGIDNPADLHRIQVRDKVRNFIIDLLHFFQLLDFETALRWEEEMDDIPDDKFTAAIFARFPDGTLENLDLTPAKVETWSRINTNVQDVTRTYVPKGKVSKYDIFWVPPLPQYKCTAEEWRNDWLALWKSHVKGATQKDVDQDDGKGTLRYHRVEGTHFTILRPENMDVFQKALNKALEDRGC